MDTPETLPSRRPDTGQIVVGLIILAMGGMLLLDRVAPSADFERGATRSSTSAPAEDVSPST